MRHFGLEEANRLVPLLSQTFERVRPMLRRMAELGHAPEEDVDALEVEADRDEMETLLERVRQELVPLEEMGIEIKAADGLVDFRALREGRTVYLCWKLGETSVAYWHELEAGFAGRRPILSTDEFTPSYPC